MLGIGLLVGMGTTWYYALQGALPMWTGCLINGFFAYGMFSVAHDGLHRAISSNSFVNELVGGIGLLFLAPYAPMQVTRWIHMQHHRFTNEKIDPDRYTHDSPIWQMPIRWSNFDLYYFIYFLRNGGEVRDKHLLLVVSFVAALVAIIGIATFAGFGYEIVMLWLIPTRVALFLVSLVFVYLPHYPGVVTHQEDPFLASTMRMGWEWLLTPLLVYQNYHLIHHLYPTVPFYKIHDVWYLKYDELSTGNVSYQSAFGLTPENIALHSPKL
jgi:fatty acid desaturase